MYFAFSFPHAISRQNRASLNTVRNSINFETDQITIEKSSYDQAQKTVDEEDNSVKNIFDHYNQPVQIQDEQLPTTSVPVDSNIIAQANNSKVDNSLMSEINEQPQNEQECESNQTIKSKSKSNTNPNPEPESNSIKSNSPQNDLENIISQNQNSQEQEYI